MVETSFIDIQDQTARSVQSDLYLHRLQKPLFLPMALKEGGCVETRHIVLCLMFSVKKAKFYFRFYKCALCK